MSAYNFFLVFQREFSTRVRKRSFIIMTIIGPFLFAAMILSPLLLATYEEEELKNIAVIDSSHLFINKIPETKNLKFTYIQTDKVQEKLKTFNQEGFWGVLFISHNVTYAPNSVTLYSQSQPGTSVKYHIEESLKKEMERQLMYTNKLYDLEKTIQAIKSHVNIRIVQIEEGGKMKETNDTLAMIVGYASGFLIYFFIFLFGSQVMRGVIEEKTNRIVEVIVSSVKPFELMMGKIAGIAAIALIQFTAWLLLTVSFITIGQKALFPEISLSETNKVVAQDIMQKQQPTQTVINIQSQAIDDKTAKMKEFYTAMNNINFGVIFGCFIFFFLGGYLLYAAIFAAIGSAVDNEADTQQFMLPVTIPLILAIYVMINTMNNPDSNLSFWFSLIPLTSPIVMMVRIPFGVPYWQAGLSMGLLVVTFIAFTWLAARIYRTGILMYGKKVTYRELYKWIKYK
ncbi:MAG TPA: ABC transporter permease [Bacteroidales bacterium]|nr:ABC transporter permease [Bacteroidales bacterium]